MRFCGMCGTPLPFRPMTAPGAQSTLNFTRVPVEASAPSRERSATISTARNAGTAETMGRNGGSTLPPQAPAPAAVEELVEPVEHAEMGTIEPASEAAVEAPAHELVPDVPLDEYVQSFHYEPPSEPTEITMRGDSSVAEQRVVADKAVVADSIAADATEQDVMATPAPTDGEVVGMSAIATDSSVESRLGLEPESPAEVVAERPRFLDIGEAPAETRPASSGTSTIVGPSFLGLSDAPEVEADYAPVEDFEEPVPRKSHWRAWLAAAVVLVFVVLGAMEWRAQSNQTDNGPVEVIKAKVRNWKNGGPSQLADQPAENASTDNNTKPDMQVQEQPKPQQQNQAANSARNPSASSNTRTSSPATASPSAAQPAVTTVTPAASKTPPPKTVQSATVVPPKAPATQNASATGTPKSGPNSPASANPKPTTTTQAAATKPKLARQDQGSNDDTAAAKSGADELSKAKSASDSAAEAAWLWKSTAKGNPDAPVLLADMYMKGDGVPRSCEQAVVLLKTAAEKENARARNRLASMYATGNCVQRNRVEAYRWLSSALVANPHSDWAQQNKDLIWQQMTPEEQAEAQRYR